MMMPVLRRTAKVERIVREMGMRSRCLLGSSKALTGVLAIASTKTADICKSVLTGDPNFKATEISPC
jgi:hypothetical protein